MEFDDITGLGSDSASVADVDTDTVAQTGITDSVDDDSSVSMNNVIIISLVIIVAIGVMGALIYHRKKKIS